MLISFKVSNSRSIGAELEFSAIATDDTALPENTIDLPQYGIKLLKTMAIFGANASGKTNILQAFADSAGIICKPDYNEKDIDFPFNRNNTENIKNDITYHFTFLVNNIAYNYTFSHNKERFTKEILTKQLNATVEEVIYSRVYNYNTKRYEWTPESFFEPKNIDFFKLSTAEHKLFLSVANVPVNPDAVPKDDLLDSIYSWFSKQLKYAVRKAWGLGQITPDYLIHFLLQSRENVEVVLDFLKDASINIKDITITKVTSDNREKLKGWSRYPYTNPEKSDDENTPVLIQTIRDIKDGNNKKQEPFDFFREDSQGTKAFLGWLGSWLFEFQRDSLPKVFMIDELDASLHPKLTLSLMRLFANKETNPHNSQLMFTTHEVKLMDRTIMRPDQLYLANKDQNGDTTIERMSDYNDDLEKYTRFDTLYMNGGMSGIPNISLL